MEKMKNGRRAAIIKKKRKYYEFTHRVSGAFTNNRHEKEKKGKKKGYTREKNIKKCSNGFF